MAEIDPRQAIRAGLDPQFAEPLEVRIRAIDGRRTMTTSRVIALEQAVIAAASRAVFSTSAILEMAESFADYIETGRIPE